MLEIIETAGGEFLVQDNLGVPLVTFTCRADAELLVQAKKMQTDAFNDFPMPGEATSHGRYVVIHGKEETIAALPPGFWLQDEPDYIGSLAKDFDARLKASQTQDGQFDDRYTPIPEDELLRKMREAAQLTKFNGGIPQPEADSPEIVEVDRGKAASSGDR